jgi:hypothetical protein
MTDLNEITQFEKDLKNLIESRNNLPTPYVNVNANANINPLGLSEEDYNIFTPFYISNADFLQH